MTGFKLPDLGEGLEEAEIVHWHVSVGDRVSIDQPLVSVETAKAVVEIPSPSAGRIVSLSGKPGDLIKVGALLAEIEPFDKADRGAIVGVIEPPSLAEPTHAPRTALRESIGAHVKAAPAVRERAHELGIDISSVRGTGLEGVITRQDVERAAKPQAEGFEPLRGVRRAMAHAMTQAGRSAVPATVTEEANVTDWPADAEVTLRAAEAVVTAAKAEPALNASFDGLHEARRLNKRVDIGIAVDTQDGLIVPVLRTSEHEGRDKLRVELRRLVQSALQRTLSHEEMKGPTITISNFGSLGGLFASLVVVPPQVAILGIGRIKEEGNSQGRVAQKRLPLSLTFDHRAVTGGEAARFITKVKTVLESTK